MNEQDNELKKALAEDGNFDAEAASRVAAEAGSWFDSRLKRMARLTWIRKIIAIAILEIGIAGLFLAISTKAMIAFAVVLLIGIVAILFVSLQYRITNAKVSLLKEIKLLRLERLGRPADRANSLASEIVSPSTSVWRDLSPRESAAWFLLLLLVAAAGFYVTSRLMSGGGTLINESLVKLSPDGSGSEVSKISYRYFGVFPMTSASIWTGEGSYKFTRWIDSRGRELPMSAATIEKNRRYTVQLVEPVMPGDEYSETLTAESPKMAEKRGELWTYRGDPQFGYAKNAYLLAVQLPKGAEVVSVDPKPAQQSVQDGAPTVRFQAIRGQNEKFTYSIQYRFAKENTPSKTAK